MGVQVQKNAIEETISELESDSEKVDFETFCKIAAKHMLEDDLENIIEEVDEDGSGTLDFDEFQEMMMG